MSIKLTQGAYARIDEMDYWKVSQYKWRLHSLGYACTWDYSQKPRKMLLMHRYIMDTPDNLVTDHLNHNKLDNRRVNLRSVTSTENNRNREFKSKSGLLGAVQRSSTRWVAYIKDSGRQIYLGSFKTPEAAHEAYVEARCRLVK